MATAKRGYTKTEEFRPVTVISPVVEMTLSVEEAVTVAAILASIGGTDGTARKFVRPVADCLYNVLGDIPTDVACTLYGDDHGNLYFNEDSLSRVADAVNELICIEGECTVVED